MLPAKTQFAVLAPVIRGQKGEYRDLFDDFRKQGFVRARVDGKVVSLSDDLSPIAQMRHNIEVVSTRPHRRPVDWQPTRRSRRHRPTVAAERLIIAMGDNATAADDPLGRATRKCGCRRRG